MGQGGLPGRTQGGYLVEAGGEGQSGEERLPGGLDSRVGGLSEKEGWLGEGQYPGEHDV